MIALLGLVAHAQVADPLEASEWDDLPLPAVDVHRPEGVVGGHQVSEGKWDDAVGLVMVESYIGCTGTLIGPKVVLTAGHCVLGYPVTHVLIGSKDWLSEDEGEIIEVDEVHEYPNSQQSYDVALLILKKASTYEPRALALECVLDEHLEDGASVQIVGFGGTSPSGGGFNSELNEAATTVLDKNCSEDVIDGRVTGCNEAVRPGGELAAGGDGISACFGDSGGPLYLKTGGEGHYVVGVASRLMFGSSALCENGAVWVRPDAVFDWIEETVGKMKIELPSCNAAPVVTVPDIEAWSRGSHRTAVAEVEIQDDDGDAAEATVEVATEPEHGSVTVSGRTLTYEAEEGYTGADPFVVAVTDEANPAFKITGDPVTSEVTVDVLVHDGRAPLFSGCSTVPVANVGWLSLVTLLGLRRRR